MFCPKCGTPLDDGVNICPTCGMVVGENNYSQQQQYQYYQAGPMLEMKWYKFLIYFSLFASAVLNAITGLQMLTGAHYGGAAEYVYSYFEGLKGLDILVGLLSIGIAALAVYTRIRLAGYFQNGPKMLLYLYASSAIINLVYIIGLNMVIGEVAEMIDTITFISSTVVSAIMIFVNKSYFDKRAHLFVN